jgi:hypothetical protein
MVLTLSFGISDVTLADTGSLAAPTAERLMRPAACLAAAGYGLTLGPFRRNRAKHDFKQWSRVGTAPPRLQRRRFGDSR